MTAFIGRREFIRLLGGAAAWPLRRAGSTGLPRSAISGHALPRLPQEGPRLTVLVQRLKELGWIEGRTVGIEYRWAGGHTERFTDFAAEFARLKGRPHCDLFDPRPVIAQ